MHVRSIRLCKETIFQLFFLSELLPYSSLYNVQYKFYWIYDKKNQNLRRLLPDMHSGRECACTLACARLCVSLSADTRGRVSTTVISQRDVSEGQKTGTLVKKEVLI